MEILNSSLSPQNNPFMYQCVYEPPYVTITLIYIIHVPSYKFYSILLSIILILQVGNSISFLRNLLVALHR